MKTAKVSLMCAASDTDETGAMQAFLFKVCSPQPAIGRLLNRQSAACSIGNQPLD